MINKKIYRAYDELSEWMGGARLTCAAAERDVKNHDDDIAKAGGISLTIVVRRDDNGAGNRCEDMDGEPVYPLHGKCCGAVRWR